MRQLTVAERVLMEQIRNLDRNIADLKRQKEAIKSGLHEIRNGNPILQGPCEIVHPVTGKKSLIKAKQ